MNDDKLVTLLGYFLVGGFSITILIGSGLALYFMLALLILAICIYAS